MQFDEFVHQIDSAIRGGVAVDGFDASDAQTATWKARVRSAAVTLAPPRNVSVTLAGAPGARPDTTWYPIDAALVPVVSKRIAAYLGEG